MTIENDILKIEIAAKGAELQSVYNKQENLEYIWQADPAYWPKHSPVLFPIVGGLKNNEYSYNGKSYQLGRHGFAREQEFVVAVPNNTSVSFLLESNEETLAVYPFTFKFFVEYNLVGNRLSVKYIVENMAEEPMYFSVGAHPAFNVPISKQTKFEDYYLLFGETENAERKVLDKEGLISHQTEALLNNTDTLALTKPLFHKDALVFDDLKSTAITLKNNIDAHGVKVSYEGFPFMGIWSKEGADFVCIEPWCGIADSEDTTGKLEEKTGIHQLAANSIFEREWHVEFY